MQQNRWSLLGALALGVAVSSLVTDGRADDKTAKEGKKTVDPTGTYTSERRSRRDDRLTKMAERRPLRRVLRALFTRTLSGPPSRRYRPIPDWSQQQLS